MKMSAETVLISYKYSKCFEESPLCSSAAGYSKKFIKLDMDKRTRSHSAKLKKSRCNTELRRHFFSERMVNRWNSLKQATVEAAEVNSFKRLLDGERLTRIDLFID